MYGLLHPLEILLPGILQRMWRCVDLQQLNQFEDPGRVNLISEV
jgi:hypothetical protein